MPVAPSPATISWAGAAAAGADSYELLPADESAAAGAALGDVAGEQALKTTVAVTTAKWMRR